MSTLGLWDSIIKIQPSVNPMKRVGLVQSGHPYHLYLFSPWYSWKIAHLVLNCNHSLHCHCPEFTKTSGLPEFSLTNTHLCPWTLNIHLYNTLNGRNIVIIFICERSHELLPLKQLNHLKSTLVGIFFIWSYSDFIWVHIAKTTGHSLAWGPCVKI